MLPQPSLPITPWQVYMWRWGLKLFEMSPKHKGGIAIFRSMDHFEGGPKACNDPSFTCTIAKIWISNFDRNLWLCHHKVSRARQGISGCVAFRHSAQPNKHLAYLVLDPEEHRWMRSCSFPPENTSNIINVKIRVSANPESARGRAHRWTWGFWESIRGVGGGGRGGQVRKCEEALGKQHDTWQKVPHCLHIDLENTCGIWQSRPLVCFVRAVLWHDGAETRFKHKWEAKKWKQMGSLRAASGASRVWEEVGRRHRGRKTFGTAREGSWMGGH